MKKENKVEENNGKLQMSKEVRVNIVLLQILTKFESLLEDDSEFNWKTLEKLRNLLQGKVEELDFQIKIAQIEQSVKKYF